MFILCRTAGTVGEYRTKVLLLAYSKSKREFDLLELSQVFRSPLEGVRAFLIDGHALKMRRAGVPLLRIPAPQHAMLSAGLSSSGLPWLPDEYSGDRWDDAQNLRVLRPR